MARILVTDDEAELRSVMAAALRQRGHTVVETRTAREALDQHRAEPFDLIVTDLVMTEMDGTELLRRLQKFSPQTPVVGVSGAKHGKMYLNMAKMIGAERVLEKPFSIEKFVDTVDAVLVTPS